MIVISGINLFQGGPLSIYYDCLKTIRELGFNQKYRIVAFVHKKELFIDYQDVAEFIELPKSRKSYLCRFYYEYYYFKKLSKREHIELWISLHDITPRVIADKLYTYCHNPSPFYKLSIDELKYGFKNYLFMNFYKLIYKVNIKNATGIIVQQDWMRQEFLKMYPVKQVVVARPNINITFPKSPLKIQNNGHLPVFIFASLPRFFKNFDVICEACKELNSKGYNNRYKVLFTIDGSENRYSRDLRIKYGNINEINWLGLLSREKVFDLYNEADCLIFPSKLETWGLPISEFKMTGKAMLLANLPYAYETLGSYEKVSFFNPDNHTTLAKQMQEIIDDSPQFEGNIEKKVSQPYAKDWKELLLFLFNSK